MQDFIEAVAEKLLNSPDTHVANVAAAFVTANPVQKQSLTAKPKGTARTKAGA